jgi:predicted ABC-type ATPase
MSEAKGRSYQVDLTFIALENADAHVARVADRVASGLHDIPEPLIRGRYDRSLDRAADALPIVDHAVFLDNSSVETPFRPVAEVVHGTVVAEADDLPRWTMRILSRFFGSAQ